MKDTVTGAGGRDSSDSREVTRGSRRTQRSERQLSEVSDASADTPTKTSQGPSQRRRRTQLEDGEDRTMVARASGSSESEWGLKEGHPWGGYRNRRRRQEGPRGWRMVTAIWTIIAGWTLASAEVERSRGWHGLKIHTKTDGRLPGNHWRTTHGGGRMREGETH